MSCGVAVNFQGFGILGGENLKRGISFKRTGQVKQIAVNTGYNRILGKTRTDRLGHIKGP